MALKGTTSAGQDILLQSTPNGDLKVAAITEDEIEHASGHGVAYSWLSANTDIDAGDTILFIKNLSDDFLILSRAIFNPSNVVCRYEIGLGGATTTPAGTEITPTNMNQVFGSSVAAGDAIAYHDETAVADATPAAAFMVNTTESLQVPLHGFILGKNQYLQINQETESTSGQVTVFGHFAEEVS